MVYDDGDVPRMWRTYQLRRIDRIRDEHAKALIPPTATAIANLSGGSQKQREDRKRQQIARLERERLLLAVKRDK